MKNPILLLILSIFLTSMKTHCQSSYPIDYPWASHSHSLTLPSWGPYMKQYNGISHVPSLESGMRFDFSIHPAYYLRRKSFPASIYSESGYHFIEASTDLSFYTVRYELEWKDKVYCDVSFYSLDNNTTAIRYRFVNNTNLTQDVDFQTFASISYPSERPYSLVPLYNAKVILPEGASWIDDKDYEFIEYANSFPQRNLVYDGQILGTARLDSAVNGSILGACEWQGKKFGVDGGDKVTYSVRISSNATHAIGIRYKMAKNTKNTFLFQSGSFQTNVTLSGKGIFSEKYLPLPNTLTGDIRLTLKATGGDPVQIDGLVLCEARDTGKIKFQVVYPEYTPEKSISGENVVSLRYRDIPGEYQIRHVNSSFVIRDFLMDKIDENLRTQIEVNKYNEIFYYNKTIRGNNMGHFTNFFIHPLILAPQSEKIFYTTLTHVIELEEKSKEPEAGELEAVYRKSQAKAVLQQYNSAGSSYSFSQQLMAATLLTNVVYPVNTMGTYILHNTPGRVWDCLYTWDNGFIALGLAGLDIRRAFECVNAYTMKPDDQSAFLHHGTPLPVQIYVMQEFWNKTQDKQMLAYLYPRLKRYYQFLAGNYQSSTTRKFKSNILCTWDYFYNSGGWDDYPPQAWVHQNKLESSVAPVVNTAHAIRTAGILKQAAIELGIKEDISLYEKDIATFTNALQNHAWDQSSGYYGYVEHNKEGTATGILKTGKGENMNKGLDGCYPLVAGICSKEQENIILKNLFDSTRIWTPIGLSAVDRSASYYTNTGYWNGCVWMPHQWFFFRSMFDLGQDEQAKKIALTALELWKKETEATYNCYEVFRIESERGGGWHQFGGLSSPVIYWFNSLFKPGTITSGFDCWIAEQTFQDDFSSLRATIKMYGKDSNKKLFWICMNEKYHYKVFVNDKEVESSELYPGTLQFFVHQTKNNTVKITINKINQ